MESALRPVGITGLGSWVPEETVSNFDLMKMIDTTDEWIVTRTGISERRKASEQEAASDLGVQAAQKALEDAGLKAEELDLILVATITPDMFFPATACLIQHEIGAVNAAAFDLSAACSGFIYALAVGSQFVATGMYRNVLVVAAETLSKIVDWRDRNTCILFGDGAGAVVLQPVEEGYGFLAFDLGSDGAGADLLKVPAGGSRKPATLETVRNNEHYITMNGNEVFKFAVKIMGETSLKSIRCAGLSPEAVDYFVPHQANNRIIDAAAKRLNLSADKVYVNLDKYGNMSSASVPVALDEAVRKGFIKKEHIVVLVGFGAGLTWGSCVLKWAK
ncbi:MAG TPA: beta-ketoacyl-ACP synthase III [Peptococcaceae bacterium]|jgi:3-oxoacyl-[acyl-carrier-protein] synthase-3|nr:ketoacyl-ACP synthase III [Clostridia bacterium]HOB81220.1 beta-ketoacyl-ACP synthase III [Peptococcaceae bacterium]HPZ70715.1 beta-ketoacyl-ACP synthase III [Peptococcaceae bacterium]HQD53306.1 beta-ketoacyl-ACP synthase III [Peptococcaceae bacterium]